VAAATAWTVKVVELMGVLPVVVIVVSRRHPVVPST